ncbi:FAD-dependent monooxygenase [Streptomyces sp. CSDS2]|uniref:FAD-dependent monooxygenase n=1 Tax=Streptomyces sp. CSDS2 TaxID=3055051 RepID=UPI0025B15752|nr:FAD-dependent monooxygenase [Streptomyces sp. CSDS2]MDN3264558.1 FAD-dependent monooxygenase [Streptomyces sp. CSDS2]
MATARTLDTRVLVVGAGPVGLLLAGELRLGGADVVVLERRTGPLTESRASTLHARTMELLDQRGLLARLGTPPRGGSGHFGGLTLDLGTPSPYAGQWKVPQARTEELLEEWARGLGARFVKGYRLTGLEERDGHVEALAEPGTPGREGLRIRAAHAVGCDGESSTVRALAGFRLSGQDATRELLRADVTGVDIPDRRFERHPGGLAIANRGPDGVTRVMTHVYGAPARPRTGPPSFAEVTDAWQRVAGEDIGGGTPLWLNAFGDTRRQAEQYRRGRVLLAGDAAHQQLPAGGQALNLGLQDAFNLGWKLAAVASGRAPESLLDTYHAERHPVGRRTLGNIAVQAHLLLGGPEVEPLRDLFAELLRLPPARAHLAAMISGVDVRYPVGAEGDRHPLLGARSPRLRLDTEAGPTDTFAVSRAGSGVLLDLAGATRLGPAVAPWTDGRVRVVRGTAGPDAPFGAALLRPDGHVAWADGTERDLHAALRRWFGPPRSR